LEQSLNNTHKELIGIRSAAAAARAGRGLPGFRTDPFERDLPHLHHLLLENSLPFQPLEGMDHLQVQAAYLQVQPNAPLATGRIRLSEIFRISTSFPG